MLSIPTISPTWATTRSGERIALLPQVDLPRNARPCGERIRLHCPIHGSDHQYSLSINCENGFGTCFSCGVRVLVPEWNPEAAARLQHRRAQRTQIPPKLLHLRSSSPAPARSLTSSQEWQTKECQALRDLYFQGAMRIDRPEAWNARAYLQARAIPIDLAETTGVGYVEVGAAQMWGEKLLQRWEDRILFPLLTFEPHSQYILGFAGRLITRWQSCADEEAHKHFLEGQGLRRWLKTNPAGWFWTPSHDQISSLIVVEGPLDRLALLAAGFEAKEVLSLVGTALQAQHLPTHAHSLLLALDSDQGGREAAQRLAQQLRLHQVHVESCIAPPSPQLQSKDWSARWRQYGPEGLEALYAHHALLSNNL
jgi:hypothetical protein